MVVTVSCGGYIKRAAFDLSGAAAAAARAAPAWRPKTRISSPASSSPRPIHAGAAPSPPKAQVYKEGLAPAALGATRGKALVNMPIEAGERINMTARAGGRGGAGDARRDVRHRLGRGAPQQALRLRQRQLRRQDRDEARGGDHIVDVQICTENDDVLLTTADGRRIRFAVPEVRVFRLACATDRRARHQPGQGRRGDLAGDPAPPGRHAG